MSLQLDSINNNNNSSSSHDTPVPPPPQPPEEEWETIYPDVRYIFSDDQFFPTVEVLNSQTTTTASAADDNDPDAAAAAAAGTIPSGTVVVDFDQTGQKIVDINSLAVDWQVAGVSLGAAAATAAVTKSPAARPSTEPDTGSPRRTTATATQQLPPPPWAEEAMQSDSVAHVLRIRGVRSARPLRLTTTPPPPRRRLPVLLVLAGRLWHRQPRSWPLFAAQMRRSDRSLTSP